MEVETTQVVIADDPVIFQDRLSDAIISAQNEDHEVEVHYATCSARGSMIHSAVVFGRSRDYWKTIGGVT